MIVCLSFLSLFLIFWVFEWGERSPIVVISHFNWLIDWVACCQFSLDCICNYLPVFLFLLKHLKRGTVERSATTVQSKNCRLEEAGRLRCALAGAEGNGGFNFLLLRSELPRDSRKNESTMPQSGAFRFSEKWAAEIEARREAIVDSWKRSVRFQSGLIRFIRFIRFIQLIRFIRLIRLIRWLGVGMIKRAFFFFSFSFLVD